MKFPVAAVQLSPTKADFSANLERTVEAAQRCWGEGAELVVFPETGLTGYFLEGGVEEVAVSSEELLSRFSSLVGGGGKDVVVGFYERRNGQIFNSSAHLSFSGGASVIHVHRKFFLPTYGVFDEERFVTRGRDLVAYDWRFGRMSILICEDVWHTIAPTICALKGAEFVVVPAASPARGFSGEKYENLERYERLLKAMCEEHGMWAVCSMLVGFEGGKGFSGGSMVVDPFGAIRAQGPMAQEHILMSEIDLDEVTRARQQNPLISDLGGVLEDVRREICEVTSE